MHGIITITITCSECHKMVQQMTVFPAYKKLVEETQRVMQIHKDYCPKLESL